ncbi:DUF4321 domain-containing protein [Anaerocolumna xylanovorans]|uniref:DUF4321 domain-containing protein n=1 Tax=Anaerocolumna xylanovorans DSM 12503 TaxID=1121345 RepID=A0A1M7Y204_9FIRM|nr:DUF4321 domain-containing protein [Anaerocolumna xylanovorans]SHO45928.1 protein of unknown function [Anaerocolumna xylanovorans DSM 12503]
MSRMNAKNTGVLLVVLLAGVVLGGFLGYLAKDVPYLTWLNYGQQFGIGSTGQDGVVKLNLGVMVISFGLSIKITIGGIIGIILAILIYRKL